MTSGKTPSKPLSEVDKGKKTEKEADEEEEVKYGKGRSLKAARVSGLVCRVDC
jgi:hypothetical protein